jgi:hypothetical protein
MKMSNNGRSVICVPQPDGGPAAFVRFLHSVCLSKARNTRLINAVVYNDSAEIRNAVTRGEDVTMTDVKAKSPSFSRRKLSAVVRKAITSYYTAEEQQEIARAAKREGISMSSFVATASLAEARRGNRKL